MAAESKLGRRIKLAVLIVFVLAIVLGIGEVLRRYFEREELAAIHRVLVEARKRDDPLIEIDPHWEALSRSLRSRLESSPAGQFAVPAHRAVIRLSNDIPGLIQLSDLATATVKFGDLLERDIPVPDQDYLWSLELQGSWDNGPWIEWYRGFWTGERWSEGEFALDTGLSDEQREKPSVFLKLRVNLKLYLGERAAAVAAADRPEELAGIPFVFQERRALGNFRVWSRGVPVGSRRP